MSVAYDLYLQQHKENVKKGFYWIRENLPELTEYAESQGIDLEWQICLNHDQSKSTLDEYDAYDAYFYGGNRSYEVVENFRRAWLKHIHRNPHHWQHWVLINDNPDEGDIVLDMPYECILEMICDFWSFSWAKGDLTEIFSWYEAHSEYMKLSTLTSVWVEHILSKIQDKLIELGVMAGEESED